MAGVGVGGDPLPRTERPEMLTKLKKQGRATQECYLRDRHNYPKKSVFKKEKALALGKHYWGGWGGGRGLLLLTTSPGNESTPSMTCTSNFDLKRDLEGDKYPMISLICAISLKNDTRKLTKQKQTHSSRDQVSGCQRGGMGSEG